MQKLKKIRINLDMDTEKKIKKVAEYFPRIKRRESCNASIKMQFQILSP